MKFAGNNEEYFELAEVDTSTKDLVEERRDGTQTILWFLEDDNRITIDDVKHQFDKNQIICLTKFNRIDVTKLNKTKLLRFNVPFYCIVNHDSEVGCKGILFYGSASTPIITFYGKDSEKLELLWGVINSEMQSHDDLQLEMLQMLLKRVLILLTRMYKNQSQLVKLDENQADIVREFNFLVNQDFRKHHKVAHYAQQLNKSPKTLSNLFGKLHDKTPSQMIQHRVLLEAKRLLRYTDRSISEIGYDIGFNDIQSFSRFFKKQVTLSPSDFRQN
jgi:AraC-like DNA-binding protein